MITTHVLDTTMGGAAIGVTVILEMRQASEWIPVGRGTTGGEGLMMPFFPEVKVTFIVRDTDDRCQVPMLLGPFGYSIYREG